MPRHERKSQSIRRFTMFVAVSICISLLVAGRPWLAGGHNRDNTPAQCGLDSLLVEGHELHASLRTRKLDLIRDLPTGLVTPGNPYLSTDDEFVEAISRGASQGRIGSEGIRSAFYARYATDENEVGCYGLEAKSKADADQREKALREIWAYTESLDRAYVHRKDLVLFVTWNDGVPQDCWESVNASLVERLNESGS